MLYNNNICHRVKEKVSESNFFSFLPVKHVIGLDICLFLICFCFVFQTITFIIINFVISVSKHTKNKQKNTPKNNLSNKWIFSRLCPDVTTMHLFLSLLRILLALALALPNVIIIHSCRYEQKSSEHPSPLDFDDFATSW